MTVLGDTAALVAVQADHVRNGVRMQDRSPAPQALELPTPTVTGDRLVAAAAQAIGRGDDEVATEHAPSERRGFRITYSAVTDKATELPLA